VAHDPFATEARNHEGVRGPVSDETATSNRFFTDDPGAEPRRVSEVPRNGVHRIWRSLARRRNIVVIVLIAAYVGWFIHLNLESYYTYGEPPFDLAVFDQGMWLISHFHIPFDTVMGRNLFGDHSSFVLYLFAPFYRLFPEPQGLLVFQTLLLAAPAIPIYVLARKYIKSTVIATALVATYLLSPLVQQGNLDQFHPEAFQVFFVSVAIYAAIESRSGLLVVMAALMLMVKEDAAVLVVPLGLWVAARRDRRLGASIVTGAVVWAMIDNWLIIPIILGTSSAYSSYLPFGGVSGIVSTLFHHPGQLFSYLGSQGRPFYLWQIASTVGFVFLFSPEIAAVGVFLVAENEISNFGYMHQILYQYSIVLGPILVLGTLYAIAQQSTLWRRNALTIVALAGALWTCTLWGFAPFSDNSVVTYTVAPTSISALNNLEQLISPNAVVSAWYPLVSHIDERSQIYVWPTPFYAENYGVGNVTGQRLPAANQVQYLLLPIHLNSGTDPKVFQDIRSDYRLVQSQGGFGLYEKKSTT
jgi:uncharacterized membrane protein